MVKIESFRNRVRRHRMADPSLSSTALAEKILDEIGPNLTVLRVMYREMAPTIASEILAGMRRAAEREASDASGRRAASGTPSATTPPAPASTPSTVSRPTSMFVSAMTDAEKWWEEYKIVPIKRGTGTIPMAEATLGDFQFNAHDKRVQATGLIAVADQYERVCKVFEHAGYSDPTTSITVLPLEILQDALAA